MQSSSVTTELPNRSRAGRCQVCGTDLGEKAPTGRPRMYCSDICRTQAWALRRVEHAIPARTAREWASVLDELTTQLTAPADRQYHAQWDLNDALIRTALGRAYEAACTLPNPRCQVCGTDLGEKAPTGRPRMYCSDICRTQAWALRRVGPGVSKPVGGVPEHQGAAELDGSGLGARNRPGAEAANCHVTTGAAPIGWARTAQEWASVLDELTTQLTTQRLAAPADRQHHDQRRLKDALIRAYNGLKMENMWDFYPSTGPGAR